MLTKILVGRRRPARLAAAGALLALALIVPHGASVMAQQQPTPTVRPPVSPQVQKGPTDTGAGVKTWQPGEAVRVVPDLRQDGSGPAVAADRQPSGQPPYVHTPIAPQVLGEDIRALERANPHEEGGPVRVIPDLRQD